MSKNNKIGCDKCSMSCKEGFTIFKREEEVNKMIESYPFFKVIKSGVGLIGKTKKEFRLMQCDLRQQDGNCQDLEMAPAFCKAAVKKVRASA